MRIGLSIGELGTSWNLVRLIGPGRAAELAFTGRTVRAAEARHIGLADQLAETGSALDAAIELAETIAENSDDSMRSTKNAFVRNLENNSFQSALEMENRGQALALQMPATRGALASLKDERIDHRRGTAPGSAPPTISGTGRSPGRERATACSGN